MGLPAGLRDGSVRGVKTTVHMEQALAEARNRAQAVANETRDKLNAEAEQARHALESKLNAKLAEAVKFAEKAKVLVESKEREIRIIKESNQREAALEELLAPLNKEKAEVMRNLLESVQTARLKNAFEKYLPAVLEDRSVKAKTVITEDRKSVV